MSVSLTSLPASLWNHLPLSVITYSQDRMKSFTFIVFQSKKWSLLYLTELVVSPFS